MTGSESLRAAFPGERVALIPYLTAGYPTLEAAREVGEAYVEAGADVVEIGVPFSDPLADGPTIQDTATRALKNGADLDYCLELASGFSGRVPVVFLVYCVAVAGVTGVRDALPPGAVELLRRARSKTTVPVALGFGIGSLEAAVRGAEEADGIIIGSKLMRLVGEGGPERAGAWLSEVREALPGVAGRRHQKLA